MTRSLLPLALAASVLLSCGTVPPGDPIEAKARDGDPVAACHLAARSLYQCALARQSWEANKVGPRPACVNEGISDQQMGYLDQADDKLSMVDRILFTGPRVELVVASVALLIAPADEAVQKTSDVQHSCDEFAGSMTD